VPAADTEVVSVCVNVALITVVLPNLLLLTALTELLAGNCVNAVATLVPLEAPELFQEACVKNMKLPA
jgi:hypothetical protein